VGLHPTIITEVGVIICPFGVTNRLAAIRALPQFTVTRGMIQALAAADVAKSLHLLSPFFNIPKAASESWPNGPTH